MFHPTTQNSDFEQIPEITLSTVNGGVNIRTIKRASEWVSAKFAQLFRKNVDEITPGPRNKDFIDNSIREPVGRTSPGSSGLKADNDNFPMGSVD